MGVLADHQIKRDIKITPLAENEIRPGKISFGLSSYGYDIRLGRKFKVFKAFPCGTVDPKNFDNRMMEEVDLSICTEHEWIEDEQHRPVECKHCRHDFDFDTNTSPICILRPQPPNYIDIPPHSFVLGESVEHFDIPRDVLCIVTGKSTYARCGIIVNVTPGEPEWQGKWTIEISNTTPLPARVYCDEGIMQAIFLRSDGKLEMLARILQDVIRWIPNVGGWGNSILGTSVGLAGETFTHWWNHKSTTCDISYADKKGRYQSQSGLTTPFVQEEKK